MADRKFVVLFTSYFLFSLFFAACATNQSLRLAEDYGKEERWGEAHRLYQEALKEDPTNPKLRKRADEIREKAAMTHFHAGKALLDQQNTLGALEEIKQAIALDPSRIDFRNALTDVLQKREAGENLKIGRKLVKVQKFNEARERFERALNFDPELTEVHEAILALDAAEKEKAATIFGLSLKTNQPITLKFENAKLSDVFSLLSKSSGINILFDKDVKPENKTLSIFIKDASFKEALNLILTSNDLFMKKVNEDTILVIPENKQKIDQYTDLKIRTFYLFNVKASEMVTLLKTMLETRRILVNEEINAIIMRDTPAKIELAEKIIETNDRRKPEVMFEVEILEVDRTKSLKFGWNFSPSSASGRIGSSAEGGGGELSLNQLKNINSDLVFFTIPSILIDFFKQDSNAKTLANPRIRVLDGKQAKINIGDKVPILLSTTTASAATGVNTGGTSVSTSTEFKDTGVKLSVEPEIHLGGDVTIKIGLEVNTLGDRVDLGGGITQFRFGTRSADTFMNVHDGETVVIGGLIRDEERKTVNKVPGLGDIPFLGWLFSGIDNSKVTTDVIMTLTPRIVHNLDVPDIELQSFWSGTEMNYSMQPLFSEAHASVDLKSEEEKQTPAPNTEKSSQVLPPNHSTRPRISIQPAQAHVSVQGDLALGFNIEDIQALVEGRSRITFDPAVLAFKRAVKGPLLQEEASARFVAIAPPGSGFVDVQWTRTPSELNKGTGTLFTIVFQGIRPGSSAIAFKTLHLIDAKQKPLPVEAHSGRVDVQ